MKTESITIRLPTHVKARLARTGSITQAIVEAVDEWIAKQDQGLRKARKVLDDAGIFDAVWARLRITGPSREPAREWAADGCIPVKSDEIEAAIAIVIANGH